LVYFRLVFWPFKLPINALFVCVLCYHDIWRCWFFLFSNAVKLNANRMVVGTLRGFDQFMNLVVDNTVEVNGDEKTDIGMVVSHRNPFFFSSLFKSLLNNFSPIIGPCFFNLVSLSCCRWSEAIVLSLLKRWNLWPERSDEWFCTCSVLGWLLTLMLFYSDVYTCMRWRSLIFYVAMKVIWILYLTSDSCCTPPPFETY